MQSPALSGSVAITVAHVFRIVLRLGSSVILTRLLYPEAFGYMAIVMSAMMIISLSTDLGVRPFLIRYPRTVHGDMLNVLWTMKLLRGLILFVIIQCISWPLADFYGDEKIGHLLRIVSYSSIISGVAPLTLPWAEKEQRLALVAGAEFAAFFVQTLGVVVTTFIYESYWCLALGAVFNAAVLTLISFHMNGYRLPSFLLDKALLKEIWTFIKWITFGSAILVAVMQADRFVIGKVFGAQTLGFYAIAMTISEALSTMAQNVGNRVGFPTWARARRNGRVKRSFARFSRLYIPACAMASGALVLLGQDVVTILYDERYAIAGLLLSILCLRTMFVGVFQASVDLLLVEGDSRAMFLANIIKLVWICSALTVLLGVMGSEDIRLYALVFAVMDLPSALFYLASAKGYRRLFAMNLGYATLGFLVGALLGYAGGLVLQLIIPWL